MELNKVVSNCTFKLMEAGHSGIIQNNVVYIDGRKANAIFEELIKEINRLQELVPANE